MPKKAKAKAPKRKRIGIFVYCSDEFKRRLDRARRFTSRTISGYVMHAALQQLEADEAAMERKRH